MKVFEVHGNEAGQRLDKLLGKYLNLAPKSFLYKMMRKKNITLNGKKCDGSEKLSSGDEVKLFLADETIEKFSQVQVQNVSGKKLDIIYEDEHILLINKPSGMLSQKAKSSDASLVEYLIAYLLEKGELTTEALRSFKPSVCNRLDRNTSGLVIAGKSLPGLQVMSEALKERTLNKYYQCIVWGELKDCKEITGYLVKDEKSNQVTIHDLEVADSSFIQTRYEPIAIHKGITRLKVTLLTGRTHQIRAHLASIGHPIIGDHKYGLPRVNQEAEKLCGIDSQMLHSWQMVMPENLKLPLSHLNGRLFEAPVPPEFMQYLGKYN